ncbi:hypothetical protein [Nocardia aurantiaca]|uniref:Uncharacterized protein n=1 Tax=Nocardia aurantiaca TaxID=2675850 RepID=A0A6I3L5Q9_9NOCA|nr:hypothetical protein [Nocardia aurantiaca]MTE16270.1 hypothetical protein [Nocardia aurantiaca]
MDSQAAYKARLDETYQPELIALAERFGPSVKIINTGGGCMAIEAALGNVPGTDHPLQLIVTTVDNGLAEDRDGILHWYACLYDVSEADDALADGHDVESLDTAYNLALSHLRDGVPASEDLCACLSAPSLD